MKFSNNGRKQTAEKLARSLCRSGIWPCFVANVVLEGNRARNFRGPQKRRQSLLLLRNNTLGFQVQNLPFRFQNTVHFLRTNLNQENFFYIQFKLIDFKIISSLFKFELKIVLIKNVLISRPFLSALADHDIYFLL